ncbi:hydroxymethylbilane synthase [Aminirod propionatiphilus]|uniref:Hydroxymethylbilane synthase n=1 Tax=Aminirod propionatiphilus TaxID=3415223 RepID=A0ACD1DYH2_9BACT|nr:hydroxymethylbilane synthase [Synergistota bacterium]
MKAHPTLLTRGSPLARRQTDLVLEALCGFGHDGCCRVVHSCGDRDRMTPLSAFGGFGVFVKALEEALFAGEGDGAVHSLKDVPCDLAPGLELACHLPRGSARDLLVTADGLSLADLPPGARVGSSSLRRRAQLLRARPDLEISSLRGNVETRLRRVDEGDLDAIVLAEAGLQRLGLDRDGARPLPFITAPGQGIVVVEASPLSAWFEAFRSLDDRSTRLQALAERSFLAQVGLGCHLPLASEARWEGDRLVLTAEILSLDGVWTERESLGFPVVDDKGAVGLGRELWTRLASRPQMETLLAACRLPMEAGVRP